MSANKYVLMAHFVCFSLFGMSESQAEYKWFNPGASDQVTLGGEKYFQFDGIVQEQMEFEQQKLQPGTIVDLACDSGNAWVVVTVRGLFSKPKSQIRLAVPNRDFDPPFEAITTADTPELALKHRQLDFERVVDPFAQGTKLYIYRRIGDTYIARTARGKTVFRYWTRVPIATVVPISGEVPKGQDSLLGPCPADVIRSVNLPKSGSQPSPT